MLSSGIHCLPPRFLGGFRHLSSNQLYLIHDHLFHVPASESECSIFPVCLPSPPTPESKPKAAATANAQAVVNEAQGPLYPLGGHCYYNGRDFERTVRRLRWLDVANQGEEGWEERYRRELRLEQSSTLVFQCCCLYFTRYKLYNIGEQ